MAEEEATDLAGDLARVETALGRGCPKIPYAHRQPKVPMKPHPPPNTVPTPAEVGARYLALWESNTPVLVINHLGRYVDANEAGLAFLEVSREKLLTLHVCDMLPEDVDCSEVLGRHQAYWQRGGRVDIPYAIQGKRKWLDVTIVPVAGGRDEIFGIGRETTAEREAVEQLSRNEAYIKAVLDDVPDLICRWRPDGTITFANRAYQQYFGEGGRSVIGGNVFDYVPAEERAVIREQVERMTPEQPVARYEHRVLNVQGQLRWQHWVDRAVFDGDRMTAIQSTGTDVTDQVGYARELERVTRILQTLSRCNSALVHARDETRLLSDICRHIVRTGGYRMAWVGLVEQDAAGRRVRPVASCGEGQAFGAELEAAWNGNGPSPYSISAAAASGETTVLQRLAERTDAYPWAAAAVECGFRAIAVIPLVEEEQVFGAMAILSDDAMAFQPSEVKLLLELAQDVAYGIHALRDAGERRRLERERIRQAKRLQEVLVQTIQAMGLAVEKRDPYTAGHQTRVSQLAAAIAEEMGLPRDQVEGVRLGALVHDIGKIAIPAEILSRPGTLSQLEYSMIRPHAEVGHEIMERVPFPWPVAEMIWEHHERLDGSGYPRGLKDGSILLESRILAVADTVEAATNHRPYRPGKPVEAILGEIEMQTGKFDPAVVDACVRLFREKHFTWH